MSAAAWVVRSGRYGERDQWALANGVSGGGWGEVPDLSACTSREDIAAVIEATYPDFTPNAQANYTGQVWALRGRIKVGDLLAMPLKTTRQIAIGRVTGGYEYLADEADPNCRHVVRVEWERTDLPRSAVQQDLLYTLGSALSIFAPTKGHAVARLESLLATGTDPGPVPFTTPLATRPVIADEDDVDEPELHADIADLARTQILAHIAAKFSGHQLTVLVQAVLEAEGFVCRSSLGGVDGGIDIVAGRGLLGMDSPRLIVQVKSGAQVGDPVVRDLLGVLSIQDAEQGLLVAWGGVTKPARMTIQNEHFRLRCWEADDVVDAVLRVYEQLPEDIRAELGLRQVWMLAEQPSA